MTHHEVEELLGAYALDAVDDDEARQVEEHIAGCPRCGAEVAAHREAAAVLAGGGAAPPGLWERIAAELQLESPTGPAPVPTLGAAGRPARRRWLPAAAAALMAVAAALAIVVGLLAARVSDLDHQVGAVQSALAGQSALAQAFAATLDPRHRQVRLTSASAPVSAELILEPGAGVAFFVPGRLADLPADRTYQLWSLVGGKPVSVGLLGARPQALRLGVAAGMTVFMVTAEPAGGTAAPTGPILLQGRTPAPT